MQISQSHDAAQNPSGMAKSGSAVEALIGAKTDKAGFSRALAAEPDRKPGKTLQAESPVIGGKKAPAETTEAVDAQGLLFQNIPVTSGDAAFVGSDGKDFIETDGANQTGPSADPRFTAPQPKVEAKPEVTPETALETRISDKISQPKDRFAALGLQIYSPDSEQQSTSSQSQKPIAMALDPPDIAAQVQPANADTDDIELTPQDGDIIADADPENPPFTVRIASQSHSQSVTAPPTQAGVARQISAQIVQALPQIQTGQVEITLDPIELGKVRLTLHPSETGMAIQVLVERPETLDLMRRHLSSLESDLSALGYDDISFDFAQDSGRNLHEDAQDAASRPDAATGPAQIFHVNPSYDPDGKALRTDGLDLRL